MVTQEEVVLKILLRTAVMGRCPITPESSSMPHTLSALLAQLLLKGF